MSACLPPTKSTRKVCLSRGRNCRTTARYALGINSFEIFEDAGYSAKNTSRPGYQQMMSRIRSGEFTHLVVWKIDRISRNLMDFTAMYSELKDLHVTFISKNEQFDTSSAIGRGYAEDHPCFC